MYSNNWTRFDSCLKTFPSLTPFIADGFAVSRSFKRYLLTFRWWDCNSCRLGKLILDYLWRSMIWVKEQCCSIWMDDPNRVKRRLVNSTWLVFVRWPEKIIRNRTSVVCNVPLYILITSTNDTLKNTHFLKKWPISGRNYFWPMNLAFFEWIFKFLEFLKNFQGMMDKIFYHGKHDSGECHL